MFDLSTTDLVGSIAALILVGSMFATLFESRRSHGFHEEVAQDPPRPGALVPWQPVAANDDLPLDKRKAA